MTIDDKIDGYVERPNPDGEENKYVFVCPRYYIAMDNKALSILCGNPSCKEDVNQCEYSTVDKVQIGNGIYDIRRVE